MRSVGPVQKEHADENTAWRTFLNLAVRVAEKSLADDLAKRERALDKAAKKLERDRKQRSFSHIVRHAMSAGGAALLSGDARDA